MKYLIHSNIRLSIDLNPCQWKIFRFVFSGPTQHEPSLRILYFKVLMISINIIIDDGSSV